MSDLKSSPLATHEPASVQPSRQNASGNLPFAHALLFTGHMIDKIDREEPRFPPWAEDRARAAIRVSVADMPWNQPGPTIGLAGAASGGDLLFHEVCAELGIPTLILLALPVADFVAVSVAPAGSDWVRRFHALLGARGQDCLRIMGRHDGLLEGHTDNIWQRANLWMIEVAIGLAPERALLALWDGAGGDGPGGTEYFVQTAPRFGIPVAPPIQMQALLRS
jgi:hypothetical protein